MTLARQTSSTLLAVRQDNATLSLNVDWALRFGHLRLHFVLLFLLLVRRLGVLLVFIGIGFTFLCFFAISGSAAATRVGALFIGALAAVPHVVFVVILFFDGSAPSTTATLLDLRLLFLLRLGLPCFFLLPRFLLLRFQTALYMVFRGAFQDGTLAMLANHCFQGSFTRFAGGEVGEGVFVEFGEDGGGRAGAGSRFGGVGTGRLGRYNLKGGQC